MSNEEAKGILRAEFIRLRAARFSDLVERLAEKQQSREVVGLSGVRYHVELEGFWDDVGDLG